MDALVCLSLSVKDGDAAETRERATLSREVADPAALLATWLAEARAVDKQAALLYVETCHRVELYAFGVDPVQLEDLWLARRGVPHSPRRLRRGQRAVEHLIRVTSSLGSEVLGETQITGQIRDAAESCRKADLLRGPLDRVVQQALRIAKKIRSSTSLGSGTVSVAHVAVDGLRDIFDSLEGKSALVVGAGPMALQALERLEANGIRDITWVNRSQTRIEQHEFAKRVRIGRFDEIHRLAWTHAITVVATASPQPILSERGLRDNPPPRAERGTGPHVVLDLGLPRNAEERIRKMDGFFLRNVDEFKDSAERGTARRREAVAAAEEILALEVAALSRTWNNWEKGPLLGELFKNLEASRSDLLREHFKLENFQEIDYIVRGILSKMMHRLVEEVDGLEETASIQVLETLNRAWRPRAQWQQNAAQPQPPAQNEAPRASPEKAPPALKAAASKPKR